MATSLDDLIDEVTSDIAADTIRVPHQATRKGGVAHKPMARGPHRPRRA